MRRQRNEALYQGLKDFFFMATWQSTRNETLKFRFSEQVTTVDYKGVALRDRRLCERALAS
jgi:hypothetical protein